jgi:hypothetical protein
MTRRVFLVTTSAVGLIGFSRISRAFLRNNERRKIVRVSFVSAFSAPFLVKELWPTRPLALICKQGLPYVALEKNLLGRLPRSAFGNLSEGASSETMIKLCVERVQRNEHERLELFVAVLKGTSSPTAT